MKIELNFNKNEQINHSPAQPKPEEPKNEEIKKEEVNPDNKEG